MDEIFEYFNENHGKGSISYTSGEKIFIKINATSTWKINSDSLTKVEDENYGTVETSPHLVLSVLRQLVNVVGVAQEDIYVGDPMKHIYKHIYDLWHPEFENVIYLDNSRDDLGRTMVIPSEDTAIFYSDSGELIWQGYDKLYTIFEEADYIINIPSLKGHLRAGMTLFAKNHFGSHTRGDAFHLHPGLIAPDGVLERPGYGRYRVQVDLLGHEMLGGKELFYLADALWATSHELNDPNKWNMEPFNGDWCSSIFLSQDPIAIASVGYDFLREEFKEEQTDTLPYRSNCVQMDGTDDYLHQAADSANWSDSIPYYDPEGDGIPIPWSLGVHEHWNNPIDKQYSRNLGYDEGIELVKILFRPESITVTSPNGGENWYIGNEYNIRWVSDNTSGYVKIEYSTDNGSVWSEIIASVPDTGIYSWTIPEVFSSNCLVRVSDTDEDPSDISNSSFTISEVPSITIGAPNGGEELVTDSTYNITWVSNGTTGEIKIEYSADNGTNWTEIVASMPDTGIYSWIVPDTVADSCLVRVSDKDGDPADMSDGVFAIVPASAIQFGKPDIYSMSVEKMVKGKHFELKYTLPEKANVIFSVYDVMGKVVKEISKVEQSGFYSEKIEATGIPAGVYFVKMKANGKEFAKTEKVLLIQ